MARLRVLFIGGSGVISSACSRLAAETGIELFVLNRGKTAIWPLPPGVTLLRADMREPVSVRKEIKGLDFDAVADWEAFIPARQVADARWMR
jgi:nucleoside-diphosphate-sugar epimerase